MAKISRVIQATRTEEDLRKIAARKQQEERVSREKWLDNNGNVTELTDVPAEVLCSHVQRLVDARRRQIDDELLNLVEGDEFEFQSAWKALTEMTFGSRMTALIRECERRGIPINTKR